jgi:hypothetical protein
MDSVNKTGEDRWHGFINVQSEEEDQIDVDIELPSP